MSNHPSFSLNELKCKCGKCGSTGAEMDAGFMQRLQGMRNAFGKPMVLSSAYRCPAHPVERGKAMPGEHCTGQAVDVAIQGADALELLQLAIRHGFGRIGISQKGSGRFIHLGTGGGRFPNPALWTY